MYINKNIKVFDVEIEYEGSTEYIHTTLCGDTEDQNNINKQDLVLIHSYGIFLITFIYYASKTKTK